MLSPHTVYNLSSGGTFAKKKYVCSFFFQNRIQNEVYQKVNFKNSDSVILPGKLFLHLFLKFWPILESLTESHMFLILDSYHHEFQLAGMIRPTHAECWVQLGKCKNNFVHFFKGKNIRVKENLLFI